MSRPNRAARGSGWRSHDRRSSLTTVPCPRRARRDVAPQSGSCSRSTGAPNAMEVESMIDGAALQGFPPEVVELSEAFFMMIVVIALGIPIIRLFARRLE